MTLAMILFGSLAAIGVAATIRDVVRDGYRRLPVRDADRRP